MALFHSSVIVTGAATDARARDQLVFVYTPRPQAMTIYVRFVEQGSVLVASTRILQISGAVDPRMFITTTGSVYQAFHDNGPLSVSSTLAAAPTIGQTVELLATLTSAGVVQISQSINGAATTSGSASSAAAIAQSWGTQQLWFNSQSTALVGYCAFRNVEIVAGVKSMQDMRVRAGTD